MSIDHNSTPRIAFWLSAVERKELQEVLTLACLEVEDVFTLATLRGVIADLGIAEARLESNRVSPDKWRVALGKGISDTPVWFSREELKAIQPALKYATSDKLRKSLT